MPDNLKYIQDDEVTEFLKEEFIKFSLRFDSITDVLSVHGEKIDNLNTAMYNGVQEKIEKINKKMDSQIAFCKNVQIEKEQNKITRLEKKVEEQKAIIEAGGNRRRTAWQRMVWWQKLMAIATILAFFYPYATVVIENAAKAVGITIEFPKP